MLNAKYSGKLLRDTEMNVIKFLPLQSLQPGAGVNGNKAFAKFEGQNFSVGNLALLPIIIQIASCQLKGK